VLIENGSILCNGSIFAWMDSNFCLSCFALYRFYLGRKFKM
jgi:hypothetical protein